jgi:hypothetical protein
MLYYTIVVEWLSRPKKYRVWDPYYEQAPVCVLSHYYSPPALGGYDDVISALTSERRMHHDHSLHATHQAVRPRPAVVLAGAVPPRVRPPHGAGELRL